MKNVIVAILFVFVFTANAQQKNAFGIKAGLNYNANGEYRAMTFSEDSSRNIGFHIGVFGKLDAGPVYIRPELIFTRTTSDYTIDDLITSKFDVPVLVGLDVLEFVSVFAGPSLQYIINSEFEDFAVEDPENDITIGAQFGVGLNFEKFGIDVRYERGLTENEAILTSVPDARVDTRPEQFIVGLSVKI